MKKEKEAHESLSLIFLRDGVPNVMVIDGAKAQVEGEFRRKLRDIVFHIKKTEQHTHSSKMGEGSLPKLKRGVGRHMLHSGCPKQSRDNCIIRKASMLSHTGPDIFGLEGQVPESKVKSESVDI
jgi:hypothetical protein